MNNCTIHELTAGADPRWNDYVKTHPQANCFHLAEWSTLSRVLYGWRPHYLFAESGDAVRGVLPLVHVTHRLGRGALVSTPFCVYGGAVADDPGTHRALEDHAAGLARKLGCAYLELRGSGQEHARWRSSDLYFTFKKALDPDHDTNLKLVPRKQRAMIRKGEKAGLRVRSGRDVATFYDLFCQSMSALGTPTYPRDLFEVLLATLGEAAEILIVERDDVPVSAVLTLYFRDEVLPYYAGGSTAARSLAAFDFMYWELMKRAVDRGCRQFDFGRSMRDTGAHAFKKNWGFEPRALPYYYDLISASVLPVKDPNARFYQTAAALWRKIPLPLANLLGPLLARSLY